MRHFLALAVMAVGCGAQLQPHVAVRPASVAVSPDIASAAARAVIDARYGVDHSVSTDTVIFGRVEQLNDAHWITNRWERGWTVIPVSAQTSFRVAAIVEYPRPGEVSVRIVGLATTGDSRFDGIEGPIQSGDPRMPSWADDRVARMQIAVNHVLRKYAVH